MDNRVKRVISLMENNLHRDWSADKLSCIVNLSPSRLHQLFKDEVGLPPAKYLHMLRMEGARSILETSYLSVKEVMRRVGLKDESHFVRDFKRQYGLTPAKYRDHFLSGSNGRTVRAGQGPLISVPDHSRPDALKLTSLTKTSAASSVTPPLLSRRPSHPRHLVEDQTPILRAKKNRELLPLLYLRHIAFAHLTTAIIDKLAHDRSGRRAPLYSKRKGSISHARPRRRG
ncbi:MAG: AraC family transcriptional regulator [Acidobacteriota bacterium]|nr:AraC family transcriptional regulator [Acidobacteriota bacterium]